MTDSIESLGIIAGNRSLPLLFAQQARSMGVKRLVAAAFDGETDTALAPLVDEIIWLKVGQLSKLISVFTDRGVKQCVMVGQIAPKNLYDVRPDLRAMGLLLRLKEKNAHTIFGGIANELKKDGVELIDALPWLTPLMPANGFLLGPKLSAEQKADIDFGFKIAKEVSRLEIGQIVVVKNGTVLAVEGFEGTDKCLARGGELAGKNGGAVAVKVAKVEHDMRFDIPCIGAQTLETCATSGISVLALEAGKTLLLERDICEKFAVKNKISVTTIENLNARMKMGTSSKFQVPSSKEAPNFKFQNGIEAISDWDLRFFWKLEFRTWNFGPHSSSLRPSTVNFMLTSHELFGFMSPNLANDIITFTFENEKPTYRATLNAVAESRHVRGVFLERQPKAQRHATMAASLARPNLEMAAGNLIRIWLLKKYKGMLVDFLNALEIKNEDGVVEDLPKSMDDAKLKTAVDILLSKYPPEAVAVYLNAFNDMNEANWANLKALLEGDSRLQLGVH